MELINHGNADGKKICSDYEQKQCRQRYFDTRWDVASRIKSELEQID